VEAAWKTKKDVFLRNEPKELLKIKELAVFRLKNELCFAPPKPQNEPKIRPKIGPRSSISRRFPHSPMRNGALFTTGAGGQDVAKSSTPDSA
jgi:hypothetical protein